jgi:hypothetical protein
MTKEAQKRIDRALHTARAAVQAEPGLVADVRLKRFHAAMDALEPGEGEEVYRVLSKEPWYAQFRKTSGRGKKK